MNVTFWVRVSPGSRTDCSGSGWVVLNTPAGALARVMVSGDPPVLDTANARVVDVPTAAAPKSMLVADKVSAGSVAPVPVSVTVRTELSLVMVNAELAAASAVGLKLVVSPTDRPAPITVPAAGTPVTPKGAVGPVEDFTVAGLAPVLVSVTGRVWVDPTGTLPNAAGDGFADRPVLLPVPVRDTVTWPAEVPTFSDPPTPPGAMGLKLTGTVTDCPLVRVLGSGTAPTPNTPGVVASPVIVTDPLATRVTVPVAVVPVATDPKFVAAPLSGTVAPREPNPMRCPSRVPT